MDINNNSADIPGVVFVPVEPPAVPPDTGVRLFHNSDDGNLLSTQDAAGVVSRVGSGVSTTALYQFYGAGSVVISAGSGNFIMDSPAPDFLDGAVWVDTTPEVLTPTVDGIWSFTLYLDDVNSDTTLIIQARRVSDSHVFSYRFVDSTNEAGASMSFSSYMEAGADIEIRMDYSTAGGDTITIRTLMFGLVVPMTATAYVP